MTAFRRVVAPWGQGGSGPRSRSFVVLQAALAARWRASALTGSNGSAIATWPASFGGYTGTGVNSPTLRTQGNSTFSDGRPAARLVRTNTQYFTLPQAVATLFASGAPMTVGVVLRRASAHDGNVLGLTVSGTTAEQIYIDNFSSGAGVPKIYDGNPHPTTTGPVTRTTEDAVCFFVRNPGGTGSVWANGQRATFSLGSDSHVYVTACIGAVISGGSPANTLNADVADLVIMTGAATDAQIAAATIEMAASLMPRWQMVFRGDSITRGSASSNYSYATTLSADGYTAWSAGEAVVQYGVRMSGQRLYEVTTGGTTAADAPTGTGSYTDGNGVSWLYVNDVLPSTCIDTLGTTGQGIMGAVAERTAISRAGANDPTNNEYDHRTDVTGLYDAYVPRAVVMFLSRNDIKFGATARQAADGLWQVLDAERAANPRDTFVAVTPLVSGDIDTSALAAIIAAEWPAHADMLWDARACPQLQDINDPQWWVEVPPPVIHPKIKGQTALCRTFPLAQIRRAVASKHLHMMLANLP